MSKTILGLAVVVVFGACGGNSVSIVGDSPQQQSEEIAGAVCEKEVECGSISVDCTSSNGTVDCVGTIERDETYDACYAETQPEILTDLEACDLTADEERVVQDCINAVLDQDCISQAELDAYIAEIEAGNEPADLRPTPAACDQTEAIFEACVPQ